MLPIIAVDKTALTFTAVAGGRVPPGQSIEIINTGYDTLVFEAEHSQDWMQLYYRGTAPDTIWVFAYAENLTSGPHDDTIRITSHRAENSPVEIPVHFTVLSGMVVTPPAVVRQVYAGGQPALPETLLVESKGGGNKIFTVEPTPAWLDIGFPGGLATDKIALNFLTEGLPSGVYTHDLVISSQEAYNSPAVVACTLTVFSWGLRHYNEAYGLRGVRFTPDGIGWAAGFLKAVDGFESALWKSVDSGVTWTFVTMPRYAALTGMTIAGGTLWFSSESGQAIESRDGGVTFKIDSTGIKDNTTDITFVGPDTGWIVGANGRVSHTVDGGHTWTLQETPTTETLFGVAFLDSQTGWVVGGSGTIISTVDGGQSWTGGQTEYWQNLRYVTVLPNRTIWVVGNSGLILYRTIGATKWASIPSGVTSDLIEICFLTPQIGWIVGRDGTILHTTDGGLTWRAQQSGTLQAIYSVFPLTADRVIVVGDNAIILDTYDGGD